MHHAPCPPALPHAHTWVYARVWLLVLALELELEFERPLSGCFFFFFLLRSACQCEMRIALLKTTPGPPRCRLIYRQLLWAVQREAHGSTAALVNPPPQP